MRRDCLTCGVIYNDTYRWTFCPHDKFEPSPSARAHLEAIGVPPDETESEAPMQGRST